MKAPVAVVRGATAEAMVAMVAPVEVAMGATEAAARAMAAAAASALVRARAGMGLVAAGTKVGAAVARGWVAEVGQRGEEAPTESARRGAAWAAERADMERKHRM